MRRTTTIIDVEFETLASEPLSLAEAQVAVRDQPGSGTLTSITPDRPDAQPPATFEPPKGPTKDFKGGVTFSVRDLEGYYAYQPDVHDRHVALQDYLGRSVSTTEQISWVDWCAAGQPAKADPDYFFTHRSIPDVLSHIIWGLERHPLGLGVLRTWVADCVERVMPLWDAACPEDPRIRQALTVYRNAGVGALPATSHVLRSEDPFTAAKQARDRARVRRDQLTEESRKTSRFFFHRAASEEERRFEAACYVGEAVGNLHGYYLQAAACAVRARGAAQDPSFLQDAEVAWQHARLLELCLLARVPGDYQRSAPPLRRGPEFWAAVHPGSGRCRGGC